MEGEEAYFSMGLNTLRVPMSMHAENRARIVRAMRDAGHSEGVVLLEGGKQALQYDTDRELEFRQESYFNFLFGVSEPDFYGCVVLATGKSVLFMPRLHPLYAVWQGEIKPPQFFKAKYAVDEVHYDDEMGSFLRQEPSGGPLFVLEGKNTDSGSYSKPASFEGMEGVNRSVDRTALHPALATCRVTKSPKELEVMRYVARVSSMAHVEVMRSVKPGMAEYQLESLFQHHTYTHGGCRFMAYTCICACGPSGAVLHYGHAAAPNDRILEESDMALLDMGAEYHCYCSDITCSFPVSGKFTANQRAVFEGVLAAQKAVMGAMRPGVSWVDMHRLASRTNLQALRAAGVLVGDLDEMVLAKLGPIFMPHGLGHLIGGDVHDVGGYLEDTPHRCMEDGEKYGICKLRTARVLQEGMVLTVEPGIYFMDTLLDEALANPAMAPFFNKERLAEFRGVGGVRLEDVVCVTASGITNFSLCPRLVEEVESVMAGGQWPPARDAAPWLCRAWDVPAQ